MTVNRKFFDDALRSRGLSLRGLARLLGLTHSQLSLTFSGKRRLQLDEAAQLAGIFNVPLHRIAEAVGVQVVMGGKGRQAKIVGALHGDGTVEIFPANHADRIDAPEGLSPDAVAIQARTVDTPIGWVDGWHFFCLMTGSIEAEAIGRFCLTKVEGGPVVMATVRRGYKDDTYNLAGLYDADSVRLEWAAPVVGSRM